MLRFRFILLFGAVLFVLSQFGCTKAPPTTVGGKPIAYWVDAYRNTDANVRKEAVFKLGNFGPNDPAVIPTLFTALRDYDARVRCEAILALSKTGPAARSATDDLVALEAKDRDLKVRVYAGKALEKLRREPPAP
jgi:HEAT repeat protein